jgi:hypothetical protein
MPARRAFVTGFTGLALMGTLAGCQKPSAAVTLVSNGDTVRAQASEYCRDGKVLVSGNECPGTGPHLTVFKVDQGGSVGVDVDKKLSESGWYIYDSDAQQKSAVKDGHYTTFVADFTNRPTIGIINLEVRQVDHKPTTDADVPKIVGLWRFQLVQKASS